MADYLYIHIPFCIRKCIYCDFTSVPFDKNLVEGYVGALRKELVLRKDSAGTLNTVYIGGGTPSVLGEDLISGLLACIRETYSVSSSAEITVEANPGTIDRSKIETLSSLGVNRISMGVQSFNDGELKTLGRIHSAEEAENSAMLIKQAGVGNFSVDLMYGIPGQTMDTWHETLKRTMDMAPTHISAYELTPEKRTPIYKMLEEGTISLPDEERILTMYDCAIDYLARNGYEQYEISNFAMPGRRCRHNVNYWDRGEYLAAGAGAHSFFAGARTRNTENIPAYIGRLRQGTLPTEASLAVTAAEEMRERLFLGLRMTDGIPLTALEPEGADITETAAGLFEEGYLAIAGENLKLTRKGMVLSNAVIVTLFEKLGL